MTGIGGPHCGAYVDIDRTSGKFLVDGGFDAVMFDRPSEAGLASVFVGVAVSLGPVRIVAEASAT